jgi:hypothetical protein
MSSPGVLRFPVSLRPHSYRWPAVRTFLLTLAGAGVAWAAVVAFYFSSQPQWGLGFPLATLVAVVAPVVVLVRGLSRVRSEHDAYDFDTVVYYDSTRIVVGHSLKGTRHEVFAAAIHAVLLVSHPPGHGRPVAATKVCCLEIVNIDGDVLQSEPHEGPARLRKFLLDARIAYREKDSPEPLG